MPPDCVVKSQTMDVVDVILSLIRQPNVGKTSWSNRRLRVERPATSEVPWSTTQSDGMWENTPFCSRDLLSYACNMILPMYPYNLLNV
jgi:hypothetical protein